MATGDIKNNLRKLKMELKKVGYNNDLDLQQMTMGVSTPFLPILHHVFSEYSLELSTYFHQKGFELYSKNDLRFLEIIYKILIQEFCLRPMLTKQQFFAVGYAEIKIIFITKIVALCWQKNQELMAKFNKKKIKSTRTKVSDLKSISTKSVINIDYSEVQAKTNGNKAFVEKHFDNGSNQLPIPNRDLALTPVKEATSKDDNKGFSNNLGCSLLDVTELDDDLELNSQIEMVESDIDLNVSPNFLVQHHGENSLPFGKKTGCAENNEEINSIDRFAADHDCRVSYPRATKDKISSDVYKKETNLEAGKCLKCDCDNSSEISHLKTKIETLERQMNEVITVNHEMSAKMILMEMKVHLLESLIQKSTQTENTTADMNDKRKPVKSPANIVLDLSPDASFADHSHIEENQQQDFGDVINEYSPIKYTDQLEEDPLFKNFKPLHLKDIVYQEEKENIFPATLPNFSKQRLSSKHVDFPARVLDNFSIHDDETQEVLKNVKQKLMETERLLKTTTSS